MRSCCLHQASLQMSELLALLSPIANLLLRFNLVHCWPPSLASAWIFCEQIPVAIMACGAMICLWESSNKLQL